MSITRAVGRAVIAIHGNAQLLGRHVGERGDVVGDLAEADQWTDFVEDRLQQGLHVVFWHGLGIVVERGAEDT